MNLILECYLDECQALEGYNWQDIFVNFVTAVIECYDLESGTWTTGEKYPQDIWEHTCVTLYIPRCRDDMEVMAAVHGRT
jgi:kelch-like protein 26